ncbi:MAG: hypothetical protein GX606_05450 [Elusimicrobia bacterium]|nr:hypothetical protein [Elusimicrobiota bacterium]
MRQLFDKIKGFSGQQFLLHFSAALLALVLIDIVFILRPQIGAFVSVGRKAGVLRSDLASLAKNSQEFERLVRVLERSRAEVRGFEAMVKQRDDLSAVFKSLTDAAQALGIKVDQIIPQPPETEPVLEVGEGKYFGQTVQVSLEAGYHDLGRFLERLEKDGLFWQLRKLSISADKSNSRRHRIILEMRLLLKEK